MTLLTEAIKNAGDTPSEAFAPVLRNGVTTEFNHVQALEDAGGRRLTTSHWFPDTAFDSGGIGLFETLEVLETIEISLYLIGVSLFADAGEEFGAPNDEGSENFDWPTLAMVRQSLEEHGFGYGAEGSQSGKFYEYPGDPLASGVGMPVNHSKPA